MNDEFPYPSQRMPVLAENVVATSQPLAAQAGLRMLLGGGNAVDAAVAAAIALTVVEPTSNGIGSDLFAIVWDGRTLHGLNASGRSPAGWTRDVFSQFSQMPTRGWDAITVPGAVSGWIELSRGFGKLAFERLFEPAIAYARDGFPVSPITAKAWQRSIAALSGFADWKATFCPGGAAPRTGERFSCPEQASTLQQIAESDGESFYRGQLAEKIAATAKAVGAHLTLDDLAAHKAEWVGTISTDYHGRRLHEIPPNGQGITALMALNILRQFALAELPVDSADSVHLQIEAMKLAIADAFAHLADPAFMRCDPLDLIDPAYGVERAKKIDRKRATLAAPGQPSKGGTVYLTAADANGMMVSLIQSNYMGFGSGIVIPGTGIAMQNRGNGFVLTKNHPNEVGPRKRPFHTIIPGFVTRAGRPVMSFGVMGGHMQPQGHVQMVTRIYDYQQNPQSASDAPRWQVLDGMKVIVERGFDPRVLDELKSRGHDISIADSIEFGGAQLIQRLENGAYLGASDSRKDGQAVGY
jgi:gamma-glutamyltranspeptidase/glutathione hydrolase